MKTTIFALCFLGATAAFGQSAVGVISSEPQPLRMIEHPMYASHHSMAVEQDLLGSSGFSYEKGELPLWEFAPVANRVPLGDIARQFKKDHLAAKKAGKILND